MKFIKNIKWVVVALLLSINTGNAQNMDIYNGCPMQGSVSQSNPPERIAKLEALNRLKNRYNFPRPQDYDANITLESLLGNYGKPDADKFSVNKAAMIEGYIVYAAKKGSVETCNCKATQTMHQDMHIEIALDPNEPKDGQTFTVEITPRMREIMHQKGVDWSHAELQKLLGKKIRIGGWMFYDTEHEKDACSYNPSKCGDISGYNRQTCWEIHPITHLEVVEEETDEMYASISSNDENAGFIPPYTPPSPPSNLKTVKTTSMEPLQMLIIILLAGILGIAGQIIRVIAGIKKANEAETAIDYTRTAFSILIAFAVGGVAGVLAAVSTIDTLTFDKSTYLAFIAAGYAGTDFIEGFTRKNKTQIEGTVNREI